MLSFLPLDILDEIWNLIESVSEGFLTYFYHIWVWWPYWSCELYGLNIFSFNQPQVALNGIWLQLAQWLLKSCLKLSYYESPGLKVKQ